MDQVVQRAAAASGFRISEPGRLQATTTVGGLTTRGHYTFELEPGTLPMPPDIMIFLLEKLVFIQHKTRALIPLLDAVALMQNAQLVYETAYKIEKGCVSVNRFSFALNKEMAQGVIESVEKNQPVPLEYQYEDKTIIFGVEIPLGPVIMTCDNLSFSTDHITKIKEGLSANKDFIELHFKSDPKHPVKNIYTNWFVDDKPSTKDASQSAQSKVARIRRSKQKRKNKRHR